MRRQHLYLAVLSSAVLGMPLAAQGGGGMRGMNMDATNKVVGSGKLPDAMEARFDQPGQALTAVDVMKMGNAVRFHSGPAAIYYEPKNTAKGEYTVSASFAQTHSMGHEAYGIFIAGPDLQSPTQHYLYFEVKPCRSRGACTGEAAKTGTPLGEILINQRTSDAKPTALVANIHDDAVNTDDPTTGAATNVLAIRVASDSLHFYVNGKQVRALPKSALNGMSTDGIFGIRVNHNSEVTVENFGVKK